MVVVARCSNSFSDYFANFQLFPLQFLVLYSNANHSIETVERIICNILTDQLFGVCSTQKQVKIHDTYHSKTGLLTWFSMVSKTPQNFYLQNKNFTFFLSFFFFFSYNTFWTGVWLDLWTLDRRKMHTYQQIFIFIATFHQTASPPHTHTTLTFAKHYTLVVVCWNKIFWVRHIKTRLEVPQ